MTKAELIDRLSNELLKDQEAMHEVLIQDKPDKCKVSFYEGSCAALRTVILILEQGGGLDE